MNRKFFRNGLVVLAVLSLGACAGGNLGGYPGSDDEGRALQRERDRDEMGEDFVAAVEFLANHPDGTGKVGAVGFCFGGSMVLRLATRLPDLDAGVSFYGRHPDGADAARIKAPITTCQKIRPKCR